MKYDGIIRLTKKNPNYRKKFKDSLVDISSYECYCCSRPNDGSPNRDELIKGYNRALFEIAEELNQSVLTYVIDTIFGTAPKQVAVVFQSMDTDTSSIPYYAMR